MNSVFLRLLAADLLCISWQSVLSCLFACVLHCQRPWQCIKCPFEDAACEFKPTGGGMSFHSQMFHTNLSGALNLSFVTYLVACRRPLRSVPPASGALKASAQPSSSPCAWPGPPALPPCAHLETSVWQMSKKKTSHNKLVEMLPVCIDIICVAQGWITALGKSITSLLPFSSLHLPHFCYGLGLAN